jgi:acetolactate synthase-1/2/3 large subunit
VHVDVPISVAEGTMTETPVPQAMPSHAGLPPVAALQAAFAALSQAKNPIAIAGVDAVNEGAGDLISQFCHAHHIPLITTYKGKGLMDEADPLCLGAAGLSPKADGILMPLMAQSDCIVLLGYDPIEMRIGWRNPWRADQPVIEIAPVARTHGMHHADHMLIGSLTETLPALSHSAPERWTDNAPVKVRDALTSAFQPPDIWGPHQVFATLRAAMPANTIITADSGAHRILVSQMWECPTPRGMLQSSGLCTMACAVPLAAGAKMGRPQAPVLAFVGDAGLEMGAGELASLTGHGLPIVICVLVDDSLSLIELKQRGTKRPNLGVDFGAEQSGTDFAALARAFGGFGVTVTDCDDLRQQATDALNRDSFTLIAARIPRRAYDGAF